MQQQIEQQLETLRAATPPILLNGSGFVTAEEYEKDKETDERFIAKQLKNVERAYEIIPLLFEKTNRYNNKCSSYGWKHYAAREYKQVNPEMKDTYMSNGAFIVAMMLHGYDWKQAKGDDNPNCYFKLKKQVISRQCKICRQEKNTREFPLMGSKVSKMCVQCSLSFGRRHKYGLDDIDVEVQKEIKKCIEDGFSLSRIASKFNIPYANLFYWQKRGFLSN